MPQAQRTNAAPPAAAAACPADALTPAMRQYALQKAEVPDAILMFRMGDFYEMFYEDAKTAARVLGLTLTTRSKEPPVPLAGIPHHALNSYLGRLVRAGFKVAISEQVEDARQAKGIIRRELLRVITPGTLTDETLLDARRGNSLVALFQSDHVSRSRGPALPSRDRKGAGSAPNAIAPPIGVACVELASGRFWAEMIPAHRLPDELARLGPAELLAAECPIDRPDAWIDELAGPLKAAVTRRPADRFDAHGAHAALLQHFGVQTLDGFGFAGVDDSLRAAGAILDYLRETQRAALGHLRRIERRHSERYLTVDATALRGLEVERTIRDGRRESSLLWAVDRTANPMGARRLREWLCFPLREPAEIVARQDAIAELRADRVRLAGVRAALGEIADIERVVGRLGVGRGSPRDLAGLGRTLREVERLAGFLRPRSALLTDLHAAFTGWRELADYLASAVKPDATAARKDGGFIADGFDAELDRLRMLGRDGARWLAEFQAREISRTGIASLKVAYNQVFGYYIEVTNPNRDKVPPEYVRRQTVRNAERYITDDLKRHEEEVLGAEERAKQREEELFTQITARVVADIERLGRLSFALADLDVLGGLSELSLERNYCRPEIVASNQDAANSLATDHWPLITISDGRHPVLDQTPGGRFVPNDCALGGDSGTLALITGPNMAGKSTYIRQIALLTLLAQTGSFVPAASMRWTPVDRIFARIGASDEIARGQSTFMVEMVETAQILNYATPRSLVVLDEIGRGTSTFDGLALAWAICEHLVRAIGCPTLFATHYHELTELADLMPGVRNLNVAVREHRRPDGGDEIVFLHKIVPGATDKSYGVHVARMAGLPAEVVRRSEQVLAELERGFVAESRAPALRPRRAPADAGDQPLLFAVEALRPADDGRGGIATESPRRDTGPQKLETDR